MGTAPQEGEKMKICPVAIAVGCRKCPIVAVCPAKGIIGDYNETAPKQADAKQASAKAKKPK
jgi:hypothetical protein